jgi:HEAT repeats
MKPPSMLPTPLENLFGYHALSGVAIAVVVLFSIVLVLSIIVITHHIITERQNRGNRISFEQASTILAPPLVANAPDLDSAVEDARHRAGDQAVALVLRRARYDLVGSVGDRITTLLESMNEVGRLVKEAQSRRAWKRSIGVRGLGECGGTAARAALINATSDPVGDVRRAAREGLLNDGTMEGLHAAIRSFITDLPKRSGWRRSFYARLAFVGADELIRLVRSGQLQGAEEKLAIEALGDAGGQSGLNLALERVGSPDGEMRASAVRVVGKVGTERELPLLLEALDDTESFVRAAAARSVEWMLAPDQRVTQPASIQAAADRLGRCLTDFSWWVRANAARTLSRIGSPGVDVLLRNLDNPDRYARDAAVAAIALAQVTPETRLIIKRRIDDLRDSAVALESLRLARQELSS